MSGSTSPFAIVVATATPKIKTPAKLPTAANKTAAHSGNALVATTVAMALAASLRPFPKSKTSARMIAITTSRKRTSGMLYHYALYHIRYCFASVYCFFKKLIYLLVLDYLNGIFLVKKLCKCIPVYVIPFVFQCMHVNIKLLHVSQLLYLHDAVVYFFHYA